MQGTQRIVYFCRNFITQKIAMPLLTSIRLDELCADSHIYSHTRVYASTFKYILVYKLISKEGSLNPLPAYKPFSIGQSRISF